MIQLENAAGAALIYTHCCTMVCVCVCVCVCACVRACVCRYQCPPQSVKKTSDLLVVMSNLFQLRDGTLVQNPARLYPELPLVKLGEHFYMKVGNTVEPSNNGHVGDECFVHYSEVVPSSEVLTCIQLLVGGTQFVHCWEVVRSSECPLSEVPL